MGRRARVSETTTFSSSPVESSSNNVMSVSNPDKAWRFWIEAVPEDVRTEISEEMFNATMTGNWIRLHALLVKWVSMGHITPAIAEFLLKTAQSAQWAHLTDQDSLGARKQTVTVHRHLEIADTSAMDIDEEIRRRLAINQESIPAREED